LLFEYNNSSILSAVPDILSSTWSISDAFHRGFVFYFLFIDFFITRIPFFQNPSLCWISHPSCCISPFLLGRWSSEGSKFKASPGKKLARPHQWKLGFMVHICHSIYVGSTNKRITAQVSLSTNTRPYSKNK
jgi:hypothetical protein